MPPSGYAPREADAIVSFLRSCSEALRAEAVRDGRTCLEGLEKEYHDIGAMLAGEPLDLVSKAVLELTRVFYARTAETLRSSRPVDYAAAVEASLDDIRNQILDIHVPPGIGARLRPDRSASPVVAS